MRNNWKMQEWDEMGGYDAMTCAVRVGNALLDGREYGQKSCEELDPYYIKLMLEDAKLISAAPKLLTALKVIHTWASVGNGALNSEDVLNLCNDAIGKATINERF